MTQLRMEQTRNNKVRLWVALLKLVLQPALLSWYLLGGLAFSLHHSTPTQEREREFP